MSITFKECLKIVETKGPSTHVKIDLNHERTLGVEFHCFTLDLERE
jgi:hypothetical protein